MFLTKDATRSAELARVSLAAQLATAIAADAKTTFAIARDAGIRHEDLMQFLGGTTEPYSKAQKTCSLEFATLVASGLTDPGSVVLDLGLFAPVVITSTALVDGTEAVAYTDTVDVTHAEAVPLAFVITSGVLPAGITLDDETGDLAGTPTTAGTYPFVVKVTDANGFFDSQALSITIAAA